MAGIGDLVARLGLDNSGFKKGLSSSRSMLSSFAGGIAGMMSPLGATFAGIAGTAGIGLMVKSSFEGVDALAKFGQKLGLTAAQAAGFQHAAELSGVSTEQLSAAMQRLSRQGLDIYKIADEIAAIENPADRSAYAFKVLGKSGSELLPMLIGGSKALREMVTEGTKLSGLEGLDASKVEAANDAISRSKAAFQGVANIVAIELAPAIEWAAIKVQQFGQWSQGGIASAIEYFSTVEYGFQHIGDTAQLFWAEFKLAAVVGYNELAHLFTVKIPAVVSFMVDNAGRLLVDGFGYAVETLADNMMDGFGEIADYVESWGDDPIEFNWKPVGKGFADVIKDMPEIAERPITALEMQLAEDADRLGKSFGEGLQQHLDSKKSEIAPVAPDAGGTGLSTPAAKVLSNKAAFFGSQEAAQIMLRGKGGEADAIPAKQLGVQQQILIATKANRPPTLTPINLGVA